MKIFGVGCPVDFSEQHRRSEIEKPRFHALSGQPGELRLEPARVFDSSFGVEGRACRVIGSRVGLTLIWPGDLQLMVLGFGFTEVSGSKALRCSVLGFGCFFVRTGAP